MSNGFFVNDDTGEMNVQGNVTNGDNWNFQNHGQLSCSSFTNHGILLNTKTFECSGSIQNHETGNNKDWSGSWALQNTKDGTLTCGGINNHASFINEGTLTCSGDFGNHEKAAQNENGLGAVRNEGTLTITGTFNNHGPVNNFGTFTMGSEPGDGASFANHSEFRNEKGGTFHKYGASFENKNNSTFLNQGTFIDHPAEGTLGVLIENATSGEVIGVDKVTNANGLVLDGSSQTINVTLFGNSENTYVIPISIAGTVRLNLNGAKITKLEDISVATPLPIYKGTALTLVDESETREGYITGTASSTVHVQDGGTLYYQSKTIVNGAVNGQLVTKDAGGIVEVLKEEDPPLVIEGETSEDPIYTGPEG